MNDEKQIPLPPALVKLFGKKVKKGFPILKYWLVDLPVALVGSNPPSKPTLEQKELDRITIAARIIEEGYDTSG